MAAEREAGGIHDQTLRRWVEQYQLALLRMCYLCLRDAALAEDAVQETFLKAYLTMPSLRAQRYEKTWLMRIAINTCRDMRRSRWFRYVDRRVTPETLPQAAEPFEEKDEALTLALMKLPERCREIVVLHYYQQLSIAEIARMLNVSASTVSTQLSRGKKKLRAALERGPGHG